jgi:SAM-dependent methyltransferase
MNFRSIKMLLKRFVHLPIHPQWHLARSEFLHHQLKTIPENSRVLDIGCFNKWPQQIAPKTTEYIGLDYYQTATEWYQSKPDVYGNALALPIANSCIDGVICLDVIEHLESANIAFNEISRILKPDGFAIIRIPFIYPLHDTPRDFVRLTPYGIQELIDSNQLSLKSLHAQGSSLQTSALLSNIALSELFINWLQKKNPLFIFIPLLPLIILINNLTSEALTYLSRGLSEKIMPFSYTFVVSKINDNTPN